MRAAVVVGPRQLELREVPPPEPAAGQVRVRLEGSGVCGSNLEVWEGRPWFEYPLDPGAPGHEGWGVVDATGPGVDDLHRGTRVAFLSQRAFAEYDVTDAAAVVPLPGELANAPFPGEPLACAVNVVRDSDVAQGDRVAIVGCGFLGLCVTRLAVLAGAEVTAITRRPAGLRVARALGATAAVPLDDLPGAGGDFDVVIEAAGRQDTLDAAAQLPRQEGTLVIAGFHQDGRREIDLGAWNWRALRLVNAHHRTGEAYVRGLREAVRLVASGAFDPRPLFTHTFRLDEAETALEAMRERPDGFVKALVLAS